MKSLTHNSPALEAMKVSLNNLRERIQEAARNDERFAAAAGAECAPTPNGCWVEDILDAGGYFEAIISADGKTFQIPFSFVDGKIQLGTDLREVIRETQYTPVASPETSAQSADPVPEQAPIEASASIAAPTTAKNEFMFMPAGVHQLSAKQGGIHIDTMVNVTKAAVPALNLQLEAINSRSEHKAFLDFDHGHGAASAWVKNFTWRETPAPGVYVQVEWSKQGRDAIEGKSYRAFSPAFHTDANPKLKKRGGVPYFEIEAGARGSAENPAEIVCNPYAALWFGGLVNAPAFDDILPITAQKSEPNTLPAAGAAGLNKQTQSGAPAPLHTMKVKTPEELAAEKAALEARNSQLETRIAELEAKQDTQSQADLKVALAEREALEAKLDNVKLLERNAALEAAETKRKEREADAAVEAMKNSGQIPMLDKEQAATWRKKFIDDPSLIVMVANRQVAGALEAGRHTRGGAQVAIIGHGSVKEGPLRVLKAIGELVAKQQAIYGLGAVECAKREELALEAAAIWAAEIRGEHRDSEGRPTMREEYLLAPLEAATDADSVGTLVGTLVLQRTLDLFQYKFPLIERILTDFSAEPGELNQTVTTRTIVRPAVQSFDNTLAADGRPNGWATAVPAQTVDASIAMDELIGIPINFSMATLSSTRRDLFGEQAEGAMSSLAEYYMLKICNKGTAANFNGYAAVTAPNALGIVKVPTAYATYAVALVDFTSNKISEVAAAFDANEVPDEMRTMLLNAQYFRKAANDPALKTFYAGQRAPEIIEQGELPGTLSGFKPVKAPYFPATNNRFGMFLQKNGLIARSRLPANLNTILPGAQVGSMTQVSTSMGFSVLLIQYVDPRRGFAEWLPCVIIGAAVGDKRGGIVGTTQ
jgi:hypothetical protein